MSTPWPPPLSWSGPQPADQAVAYILAILLRTRTLAGRQEPGHLSPPSVLKDSDIPAMAIAFAFFSEKICTSGVDSAEGVRALIRCSSMISLSVWAQHNRLLVAEAERELSTYSESSKRPGFSCFG